MSKSLPSPQVTFWTKAPDNAPEVKGYTCYFKPERLEWRVSTLWGSCVVVDVLAHGPATRVEHRQGTRLWRIEGTPEGDTRPPWLLLPLIEVTHAKLLVERLAVTHAKLLVERLADDVECGQCHRTDGHKLSCGERQ